MVLSHLKSAPAPPKHPSTLQEAHKQNEFSYDFIRVPQSFYEPYPSDYKATRSLLVINKLCHPCPPQGVTVSVLCHDVVWLTEEVLFRNKDVGFGGSVTQIVHYSLSLLAPYLIMAAAPTWLVFSKRNESSLAYKRSHFIFGETSTPLKSFFLLWFHSPRKDPFIAPHPSLSATLHLSNQAKIITHTFILEAVGGE